MTVPPLTLRKDQSDPLTAVQHDRNLVTIRDSINGLSSLLGVAIKEDGSLQDGAVNRIAILLDRVVGRDKLGWLANHFGVATLKTGKGGEYVCTITPNPLAGVDPCNPAENLKFPDPPGKAETNGTASSFVAPILFKEANTESPVSIEINGVKHSLKKDVNHPLDKGDISDGLIVWIAYDPYEDGGAGIYQAISPLSTTEKHVDSGWLPIPIEPPPRAPQVAAAGKSVELSHTKGDDLPSSVRVFLKPDEDKWTDKQAVAGFDKTDIVDGHRLMFAFNSSGTWPQPGIAISYKTNKVKVTFTAVDVSATGGAMFYYVMHETGIDTLTTSGGNRWDASKWEIRITATWA